MQDLTQADLTRQISRSLIVYKSCVCGEANDSDDDDDDDDDDGDDDDSVLMSMKFAWKLVIAVRPEDVKVYKPHSLTHQQPDITVANFPYNHTGEYHQQYANNHLDISQIKPEPLEESETHLQSSNNFSIIDNSSVNSWMDYLPIATNSCSSLSNWSDFLKQNLKAFLWNTTTNKTNQFYEKYSERDLNNQITPPQSPASTVVAGAHLPTSPLPHITTTGKTTTTTTTEDFMSTFSNLNWKLKSSSSSFPENLANDQQQPLPSIRHKNSCVASTKNNASPFICNGKLLNDGDDGVANFMLSDKIVTDKSGDEDDDNNDGDGDGDGNGDGNGNGNGDGDGDGDCDGDIDNTNWNDIVVCHQRNNDVNYADNDDITTIKEKHHFCVRKSVTKATNNSRHEYMMTTRKPKSDGRRIRLDSDKNIKHKRKRKSNKLMSKVYYNTNTIKYHSENTIMPVAIP
uniref:Uncharacterized protein n=1 Tax=Glossina austeni TaxID=7395 RepID=A0A1A9UQA7_GLOAU